MTLVPEINLANELGMCYGMIATVTDYDVWSDTPVEAAEVMKTLKENEEKTEKIVKDFIQMHVTERKCKCAERLKDARL